MVREPSDGGGGGGDEDTSMMADEDSNDQNESLPPTDPQQTGAGPSSTKKVKLEPEEEETFDPKSGIIGIDQAILKSIEKCGGSSCPLDDAVKIMLALCH